MYILLFKAVLFSDQLLEMVNYLKITSSYDVNSEEEKKTQLF